MLSELVNEAQRQQMPMAQLTWLVAGVTNNKSELSSWFTGYARERGENKSTMPAHLYRALEIGLKLKKVSDDAFVTMRSVRAES